MNLNNIISVSGMPGLYKVIAQSKGGVIVESLIDKKRVPVFASHKISALSDISMYTTGDDKPLKDVLQAINDKENGGPVSIDPKAPDAEIRTYFETVLPEFDKDRVHTSDIRKLLNWYNLLQKNDLLKAEEEPEGESKDLLSEMENKKGGAGKSAKDVGNKNMKANSTAKTTKTTGVRKTGTA